MKLVPTLCSIITPNFLPQLLALEESFHQFHPDSIFYVLWVSEFAPPSDTEKTKFLTVEELPDPKLMNRMKRYYRPHEFCCALKPRFLSHLLTRYEIEFLLFLDADITVHEELGDLWESETSSILLTPHFLSSTYLETNLEVATQVLKCGVFNAGMIGVKKKKTAMEFLNYWAQVTKEHGFKSTFGLFADQQWLDYVPALFGPALEICRKPGANVGHWNVKERGLQINSEKKWMTHSGPLLCFHWSHWKSESPNRLGVGYPPFPYFEMEELSPLSRQYQSRLKRHKTGLESPQSQPNLRFVRRLAFLHGSHPLREFLRTLLEGMANTSKNIRELLAP